MDNGEFIVYATDDGRFRAELHPIDGTIWMTQAQISEMFDKSQGTISEHIRNIYDDGECTSEATYRKFRRVQSEGGREVVRSIDAYSLEMILAVGFRVRSPRAAQFRRWANTVLQEYLIKGFAIDDRLPRTRGAWTTSTSFLSGSRRSEPRRSGSIRK